jgi:hypothetical protein
MRAIPLVVAAVAVIAGSAGPAGSAAATPSYPFPFMGHDGTYLVGKDIPPGLYLTLGGNGGDMCSWSRLASTGGGDAVSVIDRGESRDAQYALIAPTDKAFETQSCQAWSIGTRPATPIEPVPKTCIYPLTGCIDPNEGRPSP